MEDVTTKSKISKIIVYILLILMSFIMIVPFAWMILTALKTNQEAISVAPFYIFPQNGWHWSNFVKVWKSYNFLILYKNTLLMILFRVDEPKYMGHQNVVSVEGGYTNAVKKKCKNSYPKGVGQLKKEGTKLF